MGLAMVAHRAGPARPIVETATVQRVEILADHTEQPLEVRFRTSAVTMELHLGLLRLNQAADFEPDFLLAGQSAKQIRVTG